MLRTRVSQAQLNRLKRKDEHYYPDLIIYDFSVEEYQEFWHFIRNKDPKRYFYTDGVQIHKVGQLRFLFERFKGWLGFINHCQTTLVELTLAKIAYTGYINGFPLEDTPLPPAFKALLRKERSNENTTQLEQLLLSYHHRCDVAPLSESYEFGQVFLKKELVRLFPTINPQNERLISRAIYILLKEKLSPLKLNSIHATKFAERYAYQLICNAEKQQYQEPYIYKEALQWDEKIAEKLKVPFIRYYFREKKANPEAVDKALVLLEALAGSFEIKEQDIAGALIKEHIIPVEEQKKLLLPYPNTRKIMARIYLHQANAEHNKFFLLKLWSNLTLLLIEHAIAFDPDILNKIQQGQQKELEKIWYAHQFSLAINNGNFAQATTLYLNNPNTLYKPKELDLLIAHFNEQLFNNKKAIKMAMADKNYSKAEQLAAQQIELAQIKTQLTPYDSYAAKAAHINYAAVLITIEKEAPLTAKNINLEQLQKANRSLNELKLTQSDSTLEKKKHYYYNELLELRINCLIEWIKVPFSCDSTAKREQFALANKALFNELKAALHQFIEFNQSNKNGEIRPRLAQKYFLLADLLVSFESKKNEAIPYYCKAKNLMPKNLFYTERHAYYSNSEDCQKIWNKIKEQAFLQDTKYHHYLIERWTKPEDVAMSHGFDIHAVNIEPTSICSIM